MDSEFDDFKRFIFAQPEEVRKAFLGKLVAVLEAQVKELDKTWQTESYEMEKLIANMQRKISYQELIHFLNKFIYPEPVEEETEGSPETETG